MIEELQRGFRLGQFAVEPLAGVIRGPNGDTRVQPKVMEVLLCLAASHGTIVRHDDLLERVWQRPTATESLTRCISELRRVFGDARDNPQYIQTVHSRGYRLLECPELSQADPAASVAADPGRPGHETPVHGAFSNLRVMIVDDHPIARLGIRYALQESGRNISCIELDSADRLMSFTGTSDNDAFGPEDVDLILLDFNMPGLHGLAAIRRIREAFRAPVVAVSANEDPVTIESSIRAGAMGFIPKTMGGEQILNALELVWSGMVYLPPQVLGAARPDGSIALTPRQLSILKHVVRGSDTQEIAKHLNLDNDIVETELDSTYEALHVSNRVEAVYAAAQLGLDLGLFASD